MTHFLPLSVPPYFAPFLLFHWSLLLAYLLSILTSIKVLGFIMTFSSKIRWVYSSALLSIPLPLCTFAMAGIYSFLMRTLLQWILNLYTKVWYYHVDTCSQDTLNPALIVTSATSCYCPALNAFHRATLWLSFFWFLDFRTFHRAPSTDQANSGSVFKVQAHESE